MGWFDSLPFIGNNNSESTIPIPQTQVSTGQTPEQAQVSLLGQPEVDVFSGINGGKMLQMFNKAMTLANNPAAAPEIRKTFADLATKISEIFTLPASLEMTTFKGVIEQSIFFTKLVVDGLKPISNRGGGGP